VLLKAEVAELLLPSVIVNLAGRKDTDVDLHKIISLQVVFLSYLVRSKFIYIFYVNRIFR
jgi:ataxia telangiectasia mutated family protein